MPLVIGTKHNSFANPLGLLSDCHRRIEHFLKTLEKIAMQGGTLDAERRKALETALHYFRNSAPKHIEDEEQDLFPLLHLTDRPNVAYVLERLESEHARTSAYHCEIDGIFDRWMLEGCLPSDKAERLKELLRSLSDLYAAHIALEEESIFPIARTELSVQDRENIGRRMAARRGVVFEPIANPNRE